MRNYPDVNATQIRDKWDCRKSSAQIERRDISGIVAIRSGQRMVRGFHGVFVAICETVKISCLVEDTIRKAVRNAFDGPVIPYGAMVECHFISVGDLSRLHQFGTKALPGIFLGYV